MVRCRIRLRDRLCGFTRRRTLMRAVFRAAVVAVQRGRCLVSQQGREAATCHGRRAAAVAVGCSVEQGRAWSVLPHTHTRGFSSDWEAAAPPPLTMELLRRIHQEMVDSLDTERLAEELQVVAQLPDSPVVCLQQKWTQGYLTTLKERFQVIEGNVSLGFGTARPKLSHRTCARKYGLHSCREKSAGVAKRPRELISHPKPDSLPFHRCTPAPAPARSSVHYHHAL
jgi:hypothetical protein